MQLGLDSFVSTAPDTDTGRVLPAADRVAHLLDEIALADRVGLDAVGIGEHHREEFLDSAPPVLLAAAAARTERIRLASAVTVLSAADPVRVFQEFATIDLVSRGRAEITVGRGSFVEAYPLFGLDMEHYDDLFAEKLDLLLKIRDATHVTWQGSGRFRAPLTGQGVFPRPAQERIPIWLGVGGTPQSFVRAGLLGLPLMVAIIGGEPRRFRPLVDLYRQAWRQAGHPAGGERVGVHALGYAAATDEQAAADFFPGYAAAFTKIGRERGWPPVTRAQFDALAGPTGALIVGGPDSVAAKIRHYDEALGGVARMDLQMSVAALSHEKLMSSITILGERVKPMVAG